MIIHQVFLGGDIENTKYYTLQQEMYNFCLKNNIEYILWDDIKVKQDPYIKQYYNKCFYFKQNVVVISDIIRLVILKKYGGLYIDCDFKIINENFIDFFKNDIFTVAEYNKRLKNYYLNCLIYSKLDNDIIDKLMELYFLTSTFRMLYNYRKIASIHPNLFTLFIESLKDKIRIADYEYFIPDGKSELSLIHI